MSSTASFVAWIWAGCLAATPAGGERCKEIVQLPHVLPGGVADPAGRTGYLARPQGGIAAVDLRSGEVLWETRLGHLPLAVVGDHVYASARDEANVLRVVGFDTTRKGVCSFESDPIDLPKELENRRTLLTWSLAQDQIRLTVDGSSALAARSAAQFGIELRSGRVSALSEAARAPAPLPPKDLTKRVVRWQGALGHAYKALVLEEAAAEQKLVLRAYELETERPLAPRDLIQGKRLIARPTLNGQQVCVRDAAPSPDQKLDLAGQHAWSIFSLETGDKIANLPFQPGTQEIAVAGARAYCLIAGSLRGAVDRPFDHARTLRAIDLATGKTVWERPLEAKRITPPGT